MKKYYYFIVKSYKFQIKINESKYLIYLKYKTLVKGKRLIRSEEKPEY